MVGTEIITLITNYQAANSVGVEDFTDRFNFLYTVIVLVACALIGSFRQYMLKAISCYLANDPGGTNLLEFVEHFCWVQGTIPRTSNATMPDTDAQWEALEHHKIMYYQWVPFVLGVQAIFFYVPHVMWQMVCYHRTGADLNMLVNSASDAMRADYDSRKKMSEQVASILKNMIFQHREYRECKSRTSRLRQEVYRLCNLSVVSKRMGTWLIVMYLGVKVAYAVNAFGQLALMQHFLGFTSTGHFYGFTVLHDIVQGKDWRATLAFPRVAYCYAKIKHLGKVNGVTAQCVLPMNMLHEKIYLFLWFWILLTGIITIISIPLWYFRVAVGENHYAFVKKYLKLGEVLQVNKSNSAPLKKFTHEFLRHDGIFLLRMIALNAGDMIASDIVGDLWRLYQKDEKRQKCHELCSGGDSQDISLCLMESIKSMAGLKRPQYNPYYPAVTSPTLHLIRQPSEPVSPSYLESKKQVLEEIAEQEDDRSST